MEAFIIIIITIFYYYYTGRSDVGLFFRSVGQPRDPLSLPRAVTHLSTRPRGGPAQLKYDRGAYFYSIYLFERL